MGTDGMRYSLPSRDQIADCIETMHDVSVEVEPPVFFFVPYSLLRIRRFFEALLFSAALTKIPYPHFRQGYSTDALITLSGCDKTHAGALFC
jgi:dihydroxyacid dehydratase/phosphogluconate dehydratase